MSLLPVQAPPGTVYPCGQVCVCVIEMEPLELPPDISILEPEPDKVKEPVSFSEQIPFDKE